MSVFCSGFINTAQPVHAVLAVQNMEASGTIARGQDIEFKALEGSLNMMSKGLSFILSNMIVH